MSDRNKLARDLTVWALDCADSYADSWANDATELEPIDEIGAEHLRGIESALRVAAVYFRARAERGPGSSR